VLDLSESMKLVDKAENVILNLLRIIDTKDKVCIAHRSYTFGYSNQLARGEYSARTDYEKVPIL